MDTECNIHYMAHQQAIMDAQKRLDKIEATIEGIPQEMQFIRENVDRLCVNMDKILEKLETRYVPRDLYDTTLSNLRNQLEDRYRLADERIRGISDKIAWLTRGIIVCALYLIKDLIPLLLR